MLSRERDDSGSKRPVRHLVAVSAELAKTKPGADREGARTILCGDDPVFVLYRVASRYGLPVVPEWAPWFIRELNQRKAIRPLTGLGCSPVVVSGNKSTFLKWIGKALREGLIRIPGKMDRSPGSCRAISWSGRPWRQRWPCVLPLNAVVEERTKEGFVRVVLKTWSSNPDYTAGCDYAVVEIGEEFAKLALRRIDVLCGKRPSILPCPKRITGTLRRSISVLGAILPASRAKSRSQAAVGENARRPRS